MELHFPLAGSWRPFRLAALAPIRNYRLLCDAFLVCGSRDLGGLSTDVPLQIKHHYERATRLHRIELFHAKRSLGFLPLPEAQLTGEALLQGEKIKARISWYAPNAPFWEKIRVRLNVV